MDVDLLPVGHRLAGGRDAGGEAGGVEGGLLGGERRQQLERGLGGETGLEAGDLLGERGFVATAAKLMFERGVAGTTTEDVRAAAGVSSSQLYHYFADKKALVRAVIGFNHIASYAT